VIIPTALGFPTFRRRATTTFNTTFPLCIRPHLHHPLSSKTSSIVTARRSHIQLVAFTRSSPFLGNSLLLCNSNSFTRPNSNTPCLTQHLQTSTITLRARRSLPHSSGHHRYRHCHIFPFLKRCPLLRGITHPFNRLLSTPRRTSRCRSHLSCPRCRRSHPLPLGLRQVITRPPRLAVTMAAFSDPARPRRKQLLLCSHTVPHRLLATNVLTRFRAEISMAAQRDNCTPITTHQQ
jgi:hypothetical protein